MHFTDFSGVISCHSSSLWNLAHSKNMGTFHILYFFRRVEHNYDDNVFKKNTLSR